MKFFLFIIFSLFSLEVYALKVMTFNTMCDFCKGSDFFNFDKRSKNLNQIITSEDLDIIALQEVRSYGQILNITKDLKGYQIHSNNQGIISYADPTIVFKNEFTVLEKGQFWLGPNNGEFSVGWKFAVPRQVLWVKLKRDNTVFYFATSHFDNRLENLAGSAEMVRKFFENKDEPVIFAADTNLTTKMNSYSLLTGNYFENSFKKSKNFKIKGQKKKGRDLCYTKKGKVFPDCSVDHILISKSSNLEIKEFKVDLSRFDGKFPSDHRPVIVTFQALQQWPLSKK